MVVVGDYPITSNDLAPTEKAGVLPLVLSTGGQATASGTISIYVHVKCLK